jgi:predicted nucleic acid-binding protein
MTATDPPAGAPPRPDVAKVYVDTSALVALVTPEARTGALQQWLRAHDQVHLVSADWCVPEVASALAIKVRTRQIDADLADEAWNEFGTACDGLLQLTPVAATDFSLAAQMCRVPQAGLRAGDALHLAVALRSECGAMLCFDELLNRNAEANGLALIRP